jgi:hypothetical protein
MPRKRSPSSVLASKASRPTRDPEHRAPARQRAPERPVAAGGLPAGLVDVDDRRRFDLLLEPRMGRSECLPGPLDDRVDRPGRELDPEQLAGELGRVAARDPVADRERHDRGLQSRPERRPRHLAGKLGAGRAGACGAAHSAQPVLGHPHRERRQLSDLVPPRLRGVDQLLPVEHTRARAAPPRPMLDDLVHPLGRKQASAPPFVTRLAAARPAGSRPGRSRRRRWPEALARSLAGMDTSLIFCFPAEIEA